jgi:hypothetical protein
MIERDRLFPASRPRAGLVARWVIAIGLARFNISLAAARIGDRV